MTQTGVCFRFKFGFCKFKEKCVYRHVTLICDDHKCDVSQCEKRHPKICKFYRDYKRCNFTISCMYKHENQYEIFEKIEMKLEQVKCNHSDIDIEKTIKNADEKWEMMESRIEVQRKLIEENNICILCFYINLFSNY